VTAKGFVDRRGNALLFPGISAELEVSPANSVRISATTVGSQPVSADLTRIFMGGLFRRGLSSTGRTWQGGIQRGTELPGAPHPEFDVNHPSISPEALARVTRDALRAEAAVTSFVGQAYAAGVSSVLRTRLLPPRSNQLQG
jgi:hypothetical protein